MTSSPACLSPAPPRSTRRWSAVLAGAAAMALVGSSTAVSGVLVDAPLWTAQALRYAVASLLLLAAARASGQRLHRPRGAEWAWLAGVCAVGLVVFNVALVRGAAHAEPVVIGVAVAGVPLLLALIGPLLERRRPGPRTVAAAAVVTGGAVLVQGFGRSDATGLAWALLVLACEAGFTLLAVPVLARHGAWGVSVHATWLAALAFGALALVVDGPAAVLALTAADLLATAHLAVGVTAVAFVLWYSAVRRLGAGRSGLLTGVAPVAAAGSGVLLVGAVPGVVVWAGVVVVAGGLVLGLAPRRFLPVDLTKPVTMSNDS
ncbi:EamA family transporter [Paenibacillus sp. TRM 82003]|uniref:EamA family transporter n=1 Tax=Kineococcus sp. TRM81007 TaxID=2925831 RepID=UPI001F56D90C|nr:EamA family transporter [Kineococcus sp. TRM81007]MCI2237102.1 EamA family transporter [Kineococcus sp. TRM81007]MCI3926427.1 EamA family transporter [Paenibacillus sp. TRM 82003]